MNRRARARRAAATIVVAGAAAGLAVVPSLAASAASVGDGHGNASSLPPADAIKHVIVIDLENEDESTTFGTNSPATYLNDTLVPAGEFVKSYYAVGHVSLDNYIAQVSGQAPNLMTSSDCVSSITSLSGSYTDV